MDGRPICAADCSNQRPRLKVKGIDPAVSEIPDQDIAAKVTERRWRLHHSPRRVQRTVGGEAAYEVPVRFEDVDAAVTRTWKIVFSIGILQRIADK